MTDIQGERSLLDNEVAIVQRSKDEQLAMEVLLGGFPAAGEADLPVSASNVPIEADHPADEYRNVEAETVPPGDLSGPPLPHELPPDHVETIETTEVVLAVQSALCLNISVKKALRQYGPMATTAIKGELQEMIEK
jgi:hypothetical protein